MNTRAHPSAWALWPTLAATWVAFSHVVSFQGLFIWVIGGSILTAVIVMPLAFAHRRLLSLLAMLVLPFLIGGLADYLGGASAGPITRSALMASAVTGAMSVVLAGRYPQWIVPISIILLGGALGLGAADQVLWLVGMWTVAAALTFSMLGPYRQEHLRERRRLIPFAAMLALCGVVAVIGLAIVAPFVDSPWTIPGTGQTDSSVAEPPAVAEADAPEVVVPEVESVAEPPESVIEQVINWLVVVLLVVLLLVLLLIVYALLRRVWAAARWSLLRFRLRRGSPQARIVGAWTWVRLRRVRYEQPLPLWMSPDIAQDWARSSGEPELAEVAANASLIAFSPETDSLELPSLGTTSWSAALVCGRAPQGSLRQRWRWSARGPRVSDLDCVTATR
jgi:MFS family permease